MLLSLRWGCLCLAVLLTGCAREESAQGQKSKEVVVYCALDRIYSEPILREFEAETGIKVRAVYDAEAVKTVGLVNRLLAEKERPQADVFWNNELVRTLYLKREGVLQPTFPSFAADLPASMKDKDGHWYGFAARARVIVYNPDKISGRDVPKTTFGLSAPAWRGRVAMAKPLFGTTATHAAVWVAYFGKDQARRMFQELLNNRIMVEAGNSTVRDRVAEGAAWLGWTDTDDVYSGKARGQRLDMVLPDQDGMGALVIPNALSLVAGCKNPEEGHALIDYLLRPAVERKLAECASHQIPVRGSIPVPQGCYRLTDIKAMQVDWDEVLDVLTTTGEMMQELFGA
ncbi:MAG: extracellular solute-binding protein [Verrucomicrobiota bacterium]|jgi:iron(III) transport system substrate-binding protein|nr:extracellular solute-binding protein [Verrucomicrobiota bacterium]MDD8050208.1 extracellular solute-binding protein [Verrucomicrobiota bacterium]MDI9382773.1 extracellular solute-binding protein [Verrucomicrobiota bacterium]